MKKLRKGKKMLLIILIAVIAIIAAIVITNIVKNLQPEDVTPEEQQIIPLPATTYSNMEVKNIQMQYLKNNNETIVSMEIHNTTDVKVEDEDLDAILIGPDEEILGQLPTYIQTLDVGEQYDISVVLKGDLTQATQIKLKER